APPRGTSESGREKRMIVDRSNWGRLRVTGADCVRFLQGLTTVNIEALGDAASGKTPHAWGAILNPKGRVLSVIDVTRMPGDGGVVIACEPRLAEPTRALLERYAVMDDVVFESLTGAAHQTWEAAGGSEAINVWTPIIGSAAGDGAAAGALPD